MQLISDYKLQKIQNYFVDVWKYLVGMGWFLWNV